MNQEPSSESTPAAPGGHPFAAVGVGASAGGLKAFLEFLRALPPDTGMAFVLVQHLSPTHESALATILSRATSMIVEEVADEPTLQPNHVYVIPPAKDMLIVNGRLQLLAREAAGLQHPIDRFFRALAEDESQMAIGVVLSGTANDGTLGLEEIKAHGGITFAQDDSAEQQGMPHNAIASGCVDFVLSPQEIAHEIALIANHPQVSSRSTDQASEDSVGDPPLSKQTLKPIFNRLRQTCGVDFSEYKSSTLVRRVRRRMVMQKQEKLADYERLLREDSEELQALCQDVLINVTSFFRDPEMFEYLASDVIPTLLEKHPSAEPIRAWVLGCSSGEEAYSLAMLFAEAFESRGGRLSVQIFATDLSAPGVAQARAGVYSAARLHNVSKERLERFFVETKGGFRVIKPIREMCVFSRHNVISDPPFSRMDLVTCRNLLIYFEPLLQQRVIP
ncbi:MAG: chemotaxis protein CheB, partial [Planctomycetota bacterium]